MQLQERRSARGQAQRASRSRPRSRRAARLPRDVLMKLLMADMALLDRLEAMCRETALHDDAVRQRLDAVAKMARELSASKETLAAALLSLSLDEAPPRRSLS